MLPSELVEALPPGVGAQDIWAHAIVRAGLEGSAGETHLALVDGERGAALLLLARATTMTPARCEALSLSPPPILDVGSFSASWRLHTDAGRRYEVAVPHANVSEVLAVLAQLYEARGDGPEAADALAQQLSITRGASERVALLERLAALHEALGSYAEALACWIEALQLESYQPPPARARAALALYLSHPSQAHGQGDALTNALLRAERWEEAAQASRAMIARDDAPPARLHQAALALLDLGHRLRDPSLSLWALRDLLRRALARGATNDARAHLDEVEAIAQGQPPAPALAAATLSEVAAFASACDAPPQARLDLWCRIERASLAQGDTPTAILSLEQQASLCPPSDRDPLLRRRLDLLAALPDWPRWVDGALDLSSHTEDYSMACDLLLRAADAAERHLRDLPRALGLWRQVLDRIDPNHPAAIEAIARLTVTLRDWPATLKALELRLSLTLDPVAARTLLADMAHLAAQHLPPPSPDQDPPAVAYWQRLLHLDPKHPAALEALDAFFSARQRWSDLMDTLQRRVWAAHDDPAALDPLLRRLASLWQGHLANPRQALDTWQRVLTLHPHDVQVLYCVADLAARVDDLDTLERTLRALIACSDLTLDQHIDARFRLIHLLIDRLGDRDLEAIGLAWDILRLDPKRAAALDLIEARARARDDAHHLARALERRRDLTPPDQQDPLDRALGLLYATRLQRPADAIAAYTRAWDRAPGEDALFHALRDLYRATQQPDALIALKLRYADLLDQRPHQPAPPWFSADTLQHQVTARDAADHLRLAAADSAEQRGDPARALSLRIDLLPRHWADSTFLDATLRCAFASGRAFDALRALTSARASLRAADPDGAPLQRFDILFDELASSFTYRARAPLGPPDDTSGAAAGVTSSAGPALLFALAQHYAQDRAQPKLATRYLLLILDDHPQHVAAFDALCDAYKRLLDWSGLSSTLRATLRALPPIKQAPATRATRAALLRQLIDLHTYTLPDPALAADARASLRALEGGSAWALGARVLALILVVAAVAFALGALR